jgi:hypothetical protein
MPAVKRSIPSTQMMDRTREDGILTLTFVGKQTQEPAVTAGWEIVHETTNAGVSSLGFCVHH